MKVDGVPTTAIRVDDTPDGLAIFVIDQRWLPHRLIWERLRSVEEVAEAIRDMHVRGAPLIGATAAWGVYLAALRATTAPDPTARFADACELLGATRPTAVNLRWAIDRMRRGLMDMPVAAWERTAQAEARGVMAREIEQCREIGERGRSVLEEIAARKAGRPVNVLTHCNAGWLAAVDFGTATSPIYRAHDAGIPIHVWVDETRPRNQGARLTAWELGQHGVPHTVVADNTGGHLMQHGLVDVCIVGSDRVARNGDIANKIGTYLKALAARDNRIPFYVAFPASTIDWAARDGFRDIPIEQRDPREVTMVQGWHDGDIVEVRVTPEHSAAVNYGFDVTPARLISGFITERGICEASRAGLLSLYPEAATE